MLAPKSPWALLGVGNGISSSPHSPNFVAELLVCMTQAAQHHPPLAPELQGSAAPASFLPRAKDSHMDFAADVHPV